MIRNVHVGRTARCSVRPSTIFFRAAGKMVAMMTDRQLDIRTEVDSKYNL